MEKVRLKAVLSSLFAVMAGCGGGEPRESSGTAAACSGSEVCVSTIAGANGAAAAGEEGTQKLWFPYAVAVDGRGGLVVADYGNHQIAQRIEQDGRVSSTQENVSFPYPSHVAEAQDGTRYLADTYQNRILRVTPDGTTTVLAGTGRSGADDGVAAGASFSVPHGVFVDAEGSLYVADSGNALIRKITFPR
jgi:hypothetical protein